MKIKENLAISDTGFVFDPTSGETYTLNDTGVQIIKLIKEDKEEDEIKYFFIENYEVDAPTFEKAYVDFMNMLREYNLILSYD